MTEGTRSRFGAFAAILAVYVYFLIFAEFALLELARPALAAREFKLFMAVLGAGGIAGSLLAARRGASAAWLRIHLAGAALVAALACWRSAPGWTGPWPWLLAGGCGFFTGGMTVTLASSLKRACGTGLGLICGLGTGIAYALCNVPAVFVASPANQSLVACAAALAGVLSVSLLGQAEARQPDERAPRRVVFAWTFVLLALVWLDSAAFYIIQHQPLLKAATWGGPSQLWLNALAHLLGAVLAGWLLDAGRTVTVALLAFAALAAASLWLALAPGGASQAAWLYVVGVSLYSVLLVYWPSREGRPSTAALVYAVAGWLGSALGIGLAENHPELLGFLAPVAALVLYLCRRLAGVGAVRLAGMALLGLAVLAGAPDSRAYESALVRGRQVYVAEGCIHCHSQYLRPGTSDLSRWGKAPPTSATAQTDTPPLYGNRRQGPDLSTVGARRSAEWNRLHLLDPQALTPGSRMPAYAHLFAEGDDRGEALVEYLSSLGSEATDDYWKGASARTLPAAGPVTEENVRRGKALFMQLCASCHGPEGQGDGPLASRLSLRPPNFGADAWRRVSPEAAPLPQLMGIIRNGLRGEPMAGHETLEDDELVCLAEYVAELHASGPRSK